MMRFMISFSNVIKLNYVDATYLPTLSRDKWSGEEKWLGGEEWKKHMTSHISSYIILNLLVNGSIIKARSIRRGKSSKV